MSAGRANSESAGSQPAADRLATPAAVAVAAVWSWALALLSQREHLVDFYGVHAPGLPLWGFLTLPGWKLLTIVGLGAAWAVAWSRSRNPSAERLADDGRGSDLQQRWSGASRLARAPGLAWLGLAAAIPALDGLRARGLAIPYTFWEPLLLSFLSGMAAARLARHHCRPAWHGERSDVSRWFAAVVVLSAAAGGWWYWEAWDAFRDYLLGYHDFGHFAVRVINTWEGRGWLLETPSLPAFWDHFNPGLVLLAPLWGLWPDVRLFLVVQAVCLAAPAPVVFAIARRYGASPPAAAAWSATYLAFPSVGLLNLCYSYGWHPVSLALPLVFVTVWCLLRGQPWAALLAAVLACSFKESVVVILGCLAAALAVQRWLADRPPHSRWRLPIGDARLAERLPVAGWLAVWAGLLVSFLVIVALAPFAQFQTSRFSALGGSPAEILLSPLLRPHVFFGQLLRVVSACFVFGLLVPWHLPVLLRGWPVLLAAVLPVGVLLVWDHGPAFSIAFQYVTELIVVFLLAALTGAGAVRQAAGELGHRQRCGHTVAAAGALAAALTASWLFGSLPWSGHTLTLMRAQSYDFGQEPSLDNPRAAGTPGHAAVEALVARIGTPDAAVLATGRIAAHLLHIRRLEAVDEAVVRWPALEREAGAGRAAIEVFDWVLLDRYERFQQSADRIEFVIGEARRAGYREVYDEHGLILFARPSGVREGER